MKLVSEDKSQVGITCEVLDVELRRMFLKTAKV